jgi:carbon-monoxide dehydrogenase medium subunit
MKPRAFEYIRPGSLEEAVKIIADGGGMAKLLAGGQTLLPMMNLRLAWAETLVDISRLPELQGVEETANEVRIGAAVCHAAIEDGDVPDPSNGLMRQVASQLAYRGVRNRGTIGGSLALSDPSAEWPTVLTALDAVIELYGPTGVREVAINDFVLGAYDTAFEEDEIIKSITIPKHSTTTRWGYFKTCRKAGEYAASLALIVIDHERDVQRAVLGATNGRPWDLPKTAAAMVDAHEWLPQKEHEVKAMIAADIEDNECKLNAFELRIHSTTILRAARETLK